MSFKYPFIVVNGTKTAMKHFIRNYGRNHPRVSYMPIGHIERLKPSYTVKAYFLYDPEDISDSTIHDIDLPKMELFDDFIKITRKDYD